MEYAIRTAIRRRRKRPKPPGRFWILAFIVFANGQSAVRNLLDIADGSVSGFGRGVTVFLVGVEFLILWRFWPEFVDAWKKWRDDE